MAAKKPKERINSLESINKVFQMVKDFITGHRNGYKLHLSKGNTKLGAIVNVSLPPVVTCHNCSNCKLYCYAVRSYHRAENVSNAWNDNYLYFLNDQAGYFRDISKALKRKRFFRWHVSGDIVNHDYLIGMIQVAKDNPKCQFLAFTKAYQIVNQAIDNGAIIPANLHLLFSAAPGNEMPNPHRLPECHINFEDPSKNTYCGGAEYEYHCTGNCTECAVNCCGCFFLQNGDVTIINQH